MLLHAQDRVTGVRILRDAALQRAGLAARAGSGAQGEETLRADLVVHATGRTGRTAAWLPALGPAQRRLPKSS